MSSKRGLFSIFSRPKWLSRVVTWYGAFGVFFLVAGVWTARLLFSGDHVAASWLDDSFLYRQKITITNNGAAQTSYTIQLQLDTKTLIDAGKMQSDCDDMRFGSNNNASLVYFLDAGCNTAAAGAKTSVFVKVLNIPIGTSYIYMYYGNTTVASESVFFAVPNSIHMGTGIDGDATIAANKDINADDITGSCTDAGDAANYSVSALVPAGSGVVTLSTTPNASCIAAGTEILIINLMGTSADYSNVGKYETARVVSVASATLTLDRPLTNLYNGVTQKIMVQRVPNYNDVTVNTSQTLTATAWNGTKGGVLFFRANGTVTVNGSISVVDKGYVNGAGGAGGGFYTGQGANTDGKVGQGPSALSGSLTGGGATSLTQVGELCDVTSNAGAGGVGGGYSAAGTVGGSEVCSTTGSAGPLYGSALLSQLFFGAGGSGGAGSTGFGAGGANGGNAGIGGAMTYISASTLTVNSGGSITANGNTGSNSTQNFASDCYSGGGGGGAGGSVWLASNSTTLGSSLVTAAGGGGGSSGTGGASCTGTDTVSGAGGAGANGRIAVRYSTTSGTTSPSANSSAVPVAGSPASEEKTPGPLVFLRLDDGAGTSAQDSTVGNYDGTLTGGPTWQSEDQCLSGRCVYLDGSNDVVTLASTVAGVQSVSFWVKPLTTSEQLLDLNGTAYIQASSGTVSATGFTSPTIYIDGVVSSTITANEWHYVAVTTGTGISASAVKLGQISTNYGQGFFDEVKLYNFARTADQIKTDYNVGNARASTSKGTSVSMGGSNKSGEFLSNNLKAYWKMDESTWGIPNCTDAVVLDSSGSSYNLPSCPNTTGATGGVGGKYGTGGLFDGIDDYLESTSSIVDLTNDNLTISTWMYKATPASTDVVIAKKATSAAGDAGYYAYIGSSGKPTFLISDGVDQFELQDQTSVPVTQWFHIAFVIDKSSVAASDIYINGIKRNVQQTGTLSSVDSITNARNLAVAGQDNASTLFEGYLDELRVYSRALSPIEVAQLYNWAPGPISAYSFEESSGATLNDSGSNKLNGTITGTPIRSSGRYGRGLTYDSTTDFVDSGTSDLFEPRYDMSVSVWVYLNSLASETGSDQTIILKRHGSSPWLSWNIRQYFSTADRFQFQWIDAGGIVASAGTPSSGAFPIQKKTWYHLQAVREKGNIYLYINGDRNPASSLTLPDAADTLYNSTSSLRIGAESNTGNNQFYGTLDDIKIYNYARNQKQVIEDMNGGHPAGGSPIASQVAYWKMDDGVLTTANDSTPSDNDLTLSAASWIKSGKYNTAWNGTNATWLSRADDADFDLLATDSYAVSLWYKSDSAANPGATEYLFNKASATIAGYAIYANTSGNLCFGIDDDTSWGPDIPSCTTTDVYDGLWHHLVAVRDTATDKTYIYIDARELDSDIDTTTATLANSLLLYVGDRDGVNNGDEFSGDIDEIKVYRFGLTPDEVKLEYNRGSSPQLGVLGDKSTYAASATNQLYCVPGDTASCAEPVAEWGMNEGSGSSIYDSSTNAYTLTATGTTIVSGKTGKGRDFNGSSDYLTAAATVTPTGAKTISFWINGPGTSGDRAYLNNNSCSDSNSGLCFWSTDLDNKMRVQLTKGTAGVPNFSIVGATELNNDKWHLVTLTWDGTTGSNAAKLYIDAKVDTTATAATTTDNTPTSNLRLGAKSGGSPGWYYSDLIDQVRVYNYVRSPAQIAWEYSRGEPEAHFKFDECQGTLAKSSITTHTLIVPYPLSYQLGINKGSSGNTATGSCGSGISTEMWNDGTNGKFNSGIGFDGVDDVLEYDAGNPLFDNLPNTSLTLSTFVKVNTLPTGSTLVAGQLNSFNLSTNFSGSNLLFKFMVDATGAGSTTCSVSSAAIYNTGVFYHVVGRYDGSTCKIFVNGVEMASTSYSSGVYNGGAFYAGGSNSAFDGNTYHLDAIIDDLRIYFYPLTATQIKLLYNQNSAVRFGPSSGSP